MRKHPFSHWAFGRSLNLRLTHLLHHVHKVFKQWSFQHSVGGCFHSQSRQVFFFFFFFSLHGKWTALQLQMANGHSKSRHKTIIISIDLFVGMDWSVTERSVQANTKSRAFRKDSSHHNMVSEQHNKFLIIKCKTSCELTSVNGMH